MTDKRFTVEEMQNWNKRYKLDKETAKCVIDTSDGGEYWTVHGNEAYNLCIDMNALFDENEQLEEAREYYQENFLTMKTERNQFKRENEQLKSELENCRECLELNRESCARHMKENEHLKSQNRLLKGKLHRLRMEKGAMEEEIECLSEETIEQFKKDLKDGNFIEYTAR